MNRIPRYTLLGILPSENLLRLSPLLKETHGRASDCYSD